MSAALETGFFGAGERAWHGLGTVIEQDVVTSEEALTLAGLDWEVEKQPVFVDSFDGDGFDTVEGAYCIRRTTDGRVVSGSNTVGDYYRPVQNAEGFSFADHLIGEGAKWHTAGSLEGGKCVWMLARLPIELQVAGEDHVPFIFLTNRHDGKGAVKVACTPVRIVCANTLAMAVQGAKRSWSARHLSQWDNPEAMAASAAETLGFAVNYFERMAAQAQALVETKMTPSEFGRFLDQLIPLPIATGDTELIMSDRSARNLQEKRDAIDAIYRGAENLSNVRGTKWAAYNAVAEWGEWFRPVRETKIGNADEQRFSRAMLGDPQGSLADAALQILTTA